MTAAEMDALAESMLPRALELVVQVHDRDAAACRGLLAELDWQRLAALCVVLASLVPDDARVDALLAWSRRPVPAVSPEDARRNRQLLADAVGVRDTYEPRMPA